MKFKSRKIGRITSALLAAAMIITSTPQSLLTVQAAESVTQNTSPQLTNDVGTDISADFSETALNMKSAMDNNTETTQDLSAQGDTTPANPADADESTQPTGDSAGPEDSSGDTAPENGESPSANGETPPSDPTAGETSSTTPAEEAITPEDNADGIESAEPTDDNTLPADPADDDAAPTDPTEGGEELLDNESAGDAADNTIMADSQCTVWFFLNTANKPGTYKHTFFTRKCNYGTLIERDEDMFPYADGFCVTAWSKSKTSFEPWDFELDRVPSQSELKLYAYWEPSYTVTFDLQGKGDNIYLTLPQNCPIGKDFPEPTAYGFRFGGWYRSSDCNKNEKWNLETDPVTSDITLYAKWKEIGSNTVTYDLQGHGDPIVQKEVPAGPLDPEDVPTPEAKGYRFLGWYKSKECAEEEKWDFEIDKIGEDTTLYAKWEEIFYTVAFEMQGHGTPIDPLRLKEGSLIEKSEAMQPTAEGCHFEGWYKTYNADTKEYADVWDFATDTVTTDITLYAKWHELAENEFIVTFNLSGHGADFYRYLTAGSKIDAADVAQPDDNGYRLTGWYKDAVYTDTAQWNFEQDTITGATTLYAKWEEITYTVTFDLQGKGTNILKTGIKPGKTIPAADAPQPTAAGFFFDGWYQDAACTEVWVFETSPVPGEPAPVTDEPNTVTGDITLYAKWTPYYTVTFDLQGHGANIVKTNIREGSLIEWTPDLRPTAEGYHFENWYREYHADATTEEEKYTGLWNFDTDTVTADTTLYAKWKHLEADELVVTYSLNGHGADFYQYVTAGSKLKEPADPEDDGYLFLSWCTDATLKTRWNFEKDTADSSMTLYAKWKDLSTLHVAAIAPLPYTGKAIKPAVTVYARNESASEDDGDGYTVLLKNGKDYTVKYFNNTNTNTLLLTQGIESGTCQTEDTPEGGHNTTGEKGVGGFNPALPYILIEGKGIYEGKLYMNFVISQIAIGNEDGTVAAGITFGCNDQLPLGKPKKDQALIASLKYKAALKENTDYTATVTVDGTETDGSKLSKDASIWDGGDCTLTVKGIGNYTGTIVRQIIVRKKNTMLKNASLSLGAKCKSKSIFSAGDDGVTLIPAWSEVVEEDVYDKNGEPVEDKDGNIKTKKVTYYYQYIDGSWKTDKDMYEYDYDDEGNESVKKHKLDRANAFTVKLDGEWLKYGDDFTISYANNTAVGTATMTITGIGAYCGSKSVNFKITGKADKSGKAFNASTVVFAKDDEGNSGWISKFTYDGTEKTQSVTLESKKRTKIYDCGYENGDEEEYYDKNDNPHTRKHKHNKNCDSHIEIDHTFEPDEYTVTYINNVKVGTATAIFTANPESGYSGSFKKTFKITSINMAEFVTFEGGGEALAPDVTDEDVDVDTGRKDEDGEPIYKTKHIHKVNSTRKMVEARPYVSTGATLDGFSLTGDATGTLVAGIDYTFSYKNNKSVTPWKTKKWREKYESEDDNGNFKWEYGEWLYEDYPVESKMGTLVITGKGNYSGKLTIKYVIVPGELDTNEAVVVVARSEYNPNTKEYKPKVSVWTPSAGYLSAKEFSVKYEYNKKADVAAYRNDGTNPPTATVTFKKNKNYTNLSDTKNDEGKIEANYDDDPITLAPVTMQFYPCQLTAKNLYVVIDNDDPRELVYTGSQVTNVEARVYYGDPTAVKAAQKAKETGHRLLTLSADQGGAYGLQLLTQASETQEGDYTVTYGKNNAIGKNKGSITINGIGEYGGSVTQKFTIYRKPVSYTIIPVADE